jgi:hypothetical protein
MPCGVCEGAAPPSGPRRASPPPPAAPGHGGLQPTAACTCTRDRGTDRRWAARLLLRGAPGANTMRAEHHARHAASLAPSAADAPFLRHVARISDRPGHGGADAAVVAGQLGQLHQPEHRVLDGGTVRGLPGVLDLPVRVMSRRQAPRPQLRACTGYPPSAWIWRWLQPCRHCCSRRHELHAAVRPAHPDGGSAGHADPGSGHDGSRHACCCWAGRPG